MKKNFLFFCSILVVQQFFAQDAAELYRKADTLFREKDFKNSALIISNAIRSEGENANIGRYRTAAAAWALAGNADSTFHYLQLLSVSDKTNKVIARNIEFGEDFIPVSKDKRWQTVVDKIKNKAELNSYPQEEFVYGRKDGIGLTLVCIRPKVKSNGKGIISVQSGNWISSYNGIEVITQPIEQYLKKGFTVFAVFHGSQPRYAIPDAVNDLKRAIRYIRYNASGFKIDPNKIGITGGSAGGHLSLMAATADEKINETAPDPVDRVSSRVQAVAVLFPPTDFMNWGGTGMNLVNAKELLISRGVWGAVDYKVWNQKTFLYEEVKDPAERTKIAKENSPLYFVSPDDPPVFIVHGDADPTVPLQQSQAIIAKLNEAGISNRLVIKKGGKHNGNDMNPEWQEFADWFEKHLK
jgi:acetyl esterase/lipase